MISDDVTSSPGHWIINIYTFQYYYQLVSVYYTLLFHDTINLNIDIYQFEIKMMPIKWVRMGPRE